MSLILICALIGFTYVSNYSQSSAYETHQMPFDSSIYKSVLHPTLATKTIKKNNSIVFHGDRSKKKVALTFDADMTPEMKMQLDTGAINSSYNRAVIDILKRTNTKATLFLSGMWIEAYTGASKEFAENPLFELANHSYSHPGFDGKCYGLNKATSFGEEMELKKTQVLLKSITGSENKYFRFPGGCYSYDDLDTLHQHNLRAIQWDSVGQDGFNHDPNIIQENVLRETKNGSIIVLHMNGYPNSPATALALPGIISSLKEKGFEFVTVSELLDEKTEADTNVKKLFSLKLN